MANGYTQVLCFPPRYGIWTSILPLVLIAIFVCRNLKYFKTGKKKAFYVFLILLSWIALQTIKYKRFELMNLFLIYNFLLAYILATVYGKKLIILYERFITFFSMISIVVWFFYNIFTEGTLFFFSLFAIRRFGLQAYSGFVCNLATSHDLLGFRNTGMAQEPGFWASFVIIGLFFNLLIHNYNFRNKSFFILLLALITSQSTTGYSAFLVIVLLIILNSKKARLFMIFLSIVTLPAIISLPFMKEKMEDKAYSEESIMYIAHTSNYLNQTSGETFVPQRFDGFVFELMNFLYDPILGYGTKGDQNFISQTISPNISCSNGNIKVFSRYGIILGLLFYIALFLSSRVIWRNCSFSNSVLWILLYLTLGMSYELTTLPILLSIWFLSVFSYRLPIRFSRLKRRRIKRLQPISQSKVLEN